jgi:hypothetical protein
LQLSDQDLTLLREHFHEAVQDTEVECWCDHLPADMPFLTCVAEVLYCIVLFIKTRNMKIPYV